MEPISESNDKPPRVKNQKSASANGDRFRPCLIGIDQQLDIRPQSVADLSNTVDVGREVGAANAHFHRPMALRTKFLRLGNDLFNRIVQPQA